MRPIFRGEDMPIFMDDASKVAPPRASLIIQGRLALHRYEDMVLLEIGNSTLPLFPDDMAQIIRFMNTQQEGIEHARFERERKAELERMKGEQ